MKQQNLFGDDFEIKEESQYTSKINLPTYEPSRLKPDIFLLCDTLKSNKLIREIEQSEIMVEEKKFLIEAAKRHTVFNYELIADYYVHASPEMQKLMEKSALVLIDFNSAFVNGYIQLANDLAQQHLEKYGE